MQPTESYQIPPPFARLFVWSAANMPDVTTILRSLPPEVRTAATQAALSATDSSVKSLEGSTSSVSAVTWVTWLIRIALLIGGGYGFAWAQESSKWTGEYLPMIAALVVAGGGAAWSFLQKQIQAWREHQIALASAAASAAATARAGAPVEVPIQPPPAQV